jgi:hypothetical protein
MDRGSSSGGGRWKARREEVGRIAWSHRERQRLRDREAAGLGPGRKRRRCGLTDRVVAPPAFRFFTANRWETRLYSQRIHANEVRPRLTAISGPLRADDICKPHASSPTRSSMCKILLLSHASLLACPGRFEAQRLRAPTWPPR